MNHTDKISSAEKILKEPLESFFITIYPPDKMISHGLSHHRRVWEYAKELVILSETEEGRDEGLYLQNLLIACYLHDIGIATDPGSGHGSLSKDYCLTFIKNTNLEEHIYSDAIDAIENHDNKDYITPLKDNKLLRILSVADDLDAFGYIGIYRYTEIYILRGIDPVLIGEKVMLNLQKRFGNFSNVCICHPEFIKRHKARFDETYDFFRNYSLQVINYSFNNKSPSGYCGIIDLISGISDNITTFDEVLNRADEFIHDPIIYTFIKRMDEIKRPCI
jgi:HD superfamily phosphodiesterase